MHALSNPELTLNGHYVLFYITRMSFGAHHKNMNEDRPIGLLSAAKCRPEIDVSSKIRVISWASLDRGRQMRVR